MGGVITAMTIVDELKDALGCTSVAAAVLFGSFIEKEEYRDIDIIVVLEAIGEMDEITRIKEALSLIDSRIDPTFITTLTFEENVSIGNPFYLNVLNGRAVIGNDYLERFREDAGVPSEEIIQRYLDFSVHAYRKAMATGDYFDCYAACKFLIEHLMMKRGTYVTDPHRYDSYLRELDLPLDDVSVDVISRILTHRRGDMELREGDCEHVLRILGGTLANLRHGPTIQ
ncbi:MAG: hypothetical protein C5S48_04000 [Candidatus Methanogaster sp.]|nr:MAG: hypothetical protein C5S48_04000 [ANME-2 cluster archaeon]